MERMSDIGREIIFVGNLAKILLPLYILLLLFASTYINKNHLRYESLIQYCHFGFSFDFKFFFFFLEQTIIVHFLMSCVSFWDWIGQYVPSLGNGKCNDHPIIVNGHLCLDVELFIFMEVYVSLYTEINQCLLIVLQCKQ